MLRVSGGVLSSSLYYGGMAIRRGDPDWFPCGHPRVPGNLTSKRDCAECNRIRSARVAQAKREERIARYGSSRKPPEGYDPLRFPCGHPRTPENAKGGRNTCKECNRLKQAERYRAEREAAGKAIYKPDPDWFPCGHPRTAANFTRAKRCRACANERKLKDYREGRSYPTPGDPDLIRARDQAYVQCRRDERADPETWDFVQIIRRDPCSYCGGPGGTRDHIVPMSDEGPNHWSNYTGACQSCNLSKSDKPLLTFLLDRLMFQQLGKRKSA
jgi:hypothetical protein